MDRIERMIEAGRADDARDVARKWLDRNEGDRRVEAVRALLDEATWLVLAEEPRREELAAYRAEFPDSPHHDEARELEGNLAFYAALKEESEDALRAVIDHYSGTKAALAAVEKAAEAGFGAAEIAGTAEAWSRWLSRYPGQPGEDAAREKLYAAAWTEAEREDTPAAWLSLRASLPDHPRADEAREREATLVVQGASGADELMQAAERFKGTEAGRSALRRSLFLAEVVALRAGDAPLRRGPDGIVRPALTESAEPLGKVLQKGEPLVSDTLAVWLRLAKEPDKVAPEWMVTGIQPAEDPGWLVAEGAGFGAARHAGIGLLGMRAEGFGNLEVELKVGGAIELPGGEEPRVVARAAVRPPDCLSAIKGTTWRLLRGWEPCMDGLLSGEDDGYWLSSAEAFAAAEAPEDPAGPWTTGGCPVPPFDPQGGLGDDDDDSADAAAESGAAEAGDDDDSAAPVQVAPPVPAFAGLGAPTASLARDLDGDGVADGLHLLPHPGGVAIVVVDGRGLATRVFVREAADVAALERVRHEGCGYVLAEPGQ